MRCVTTSLSDPDSKLNSNFDSLHFANQMQTCLIQNSIPCIHPIPCTQNATPVPFPKNCYRLHFSCRSHIFTLHNEPTHRSGPISGNGDISPSIAPTVRLLIFLILNASCFSLSPSTASIISMPWSSVAGDHAR